MKALFGIIALVMVFGCTEKTKRKISDLNKYGAALTAETRKILGRLASSKSSPEEENDFDLKYEQETYTYTVGKEIPENKPEVGSEEKTTFEIEPDLPEGLSFNAATGAISGTPKVESVKTSYTITAENSEGTAVQVIEITVVTENSFTDPPENTTEILAPDEITYPKTPLELVEGETMEEGFIPMVKNEAKVEFSIDPQLPEGLSFDKSTGGISGTPGSVLVKTKFRITAENEKGSVTVELEIIVAAKKEEAKSAVVEEETEVEDEEKGEVTVEEKTTEDEAGKEGKTSVKKPEDETVTTEAEATETEEEATATSTEDPADATAAAAAAEAEDVVTGVTPPAATEESDEGFDDESDASSDGTDEGGQGLAEDTPESTPLVKALAPGKIVSYDETKIGVRVRLVTALRFENDSFSLEFIKPTSIAWPQPAALAATEAKPTKGDETQEAEEDTPMMVLNLQSKTKVLGQIPLGKPESRKGWLHLKPDSATPLVFPLEAKNIDELKKLLSTAELVLSESVSVPEKVKNALLHTPMPAAASFAWINWPADKRIWFGNLAEKPNVKATKIIPLEQKTKAATYDQLRLILFSGSDKAMIEGNWIINGTMDLDADPKNVDKLEKNNICSGSRVNASVESERMFNVETKDSNTGVFLQTSLIEKGITIH